MISPDVDGFRTFLFTYRHEGAEWCFEIPAKDADDAEARLAKMQYATLEGEIRVKLPARLGAVARALVVVRNLFNTAAPQDR